MRARDGCRRRAVDHRHTSARGGARCAAPVQILTNILFVTDGPPPHRNGAPARGVVTACELRGRALIPVVSRRLLRSSQSNAQTDPKVNHF